MLVFAASDKGGTGRSVTSSNIMYRRALRGADVCYLDFDFGSPTAGAIFQVPAVVRGTREGGLHAYLRGDVSTPHRVDVWSEAEGLWPREKPPGSGRLFLCPGDEGHGEFPLSAEMVKRCGDLFLRLDEEFDCSLFDLSAGRSYATQLVLAASALPELRGVTTRWLIFHRWTRQHIIAAAGLVHGERGILETGTRFGHDPQELRDAIRFVRTAVLDPEAPEMAALRAEQLAWLRDCDHDLVSLAAARRLGRTEMLGAVPLDPLLQWREQLISDHDVWGSRIANPQTVAAFDELASRIADDSAWESL